jgi:hypothetical protein
MSDEGGNGFSRISILSFPPHLTRGNKESQDMKRAMFSVLTLIVLAGLTGCAGHRPRPAACVGGGCDAAPQTCGQAQAGCQSGEAARDDGADPAKKHCCRLFGRGAKQPAEPSEQAAAAPGPPTGAITYPYYTVRGPRDFLAKNPQSIGP